MGRRALAWALTLATTIGLAWQGAESASSSTDDTCLSIAKAGPADIPVEKRRISACTGLLRDEALADRRGPLLIARAQGYVRTEAYMRALLDLQEAKDLGSNAAALSFDRAWTFEEMGYNSLSLPEVENTIRLGNHSTGIYLMRSIDRALTGHYGEAIEDADLVISEDASLASAYSVRGYARLEIGEIDQAIEDFDRALRLRPGPAETYYYRGRAHFALDQFDAALSDYEQAQRLAPSDYTTGIIDDVKAAMAAPPAPISTEAANAAAPPDSPSRAVGHTHNCAAYYPFLSSRLSEVGDVLVHYDVSETGAISNVGVGRSSGYPLLDRAAVICVSRRWRNLPAMKSGSPFATPNHQAVIRFQTLPGTGPDLFHAKGLLAVGRYDDAIAEFGLILASDPGNADLYFRRGFALYVQGQYVDAARDFDKALSLKPDFDDAIAARELVRKAAMAAAPPAQNGI
jgi:TonB family protein